MNAMFSSILLELGPLQTILTFLGYKQEKVLSLCCKILSNLITCYRKWNICFYPLINPFDRKTRLLVNVSFSIHFDPGTPLTNLEIYETKIKKQIRSSNFQDKIYSIYVKYINDSIGYGVFSNSTIPKGICLFMYGSESIKSDELAKRNKIYDSKGLNYVLTVKEASEISNFIFNTNYDATYFGNVSRFINHSCLPNLNICIYRQELLLGLPLFFTNRVINRGEQLTFDYKSNVQNQPNCNITSLPTNPFCLSNNKSIKRKICLCKSTSCQGYLPAD